MRSEMVFHRKGVWNYECYDKTAGGWRQATNLTIDRSELLDDLRDLAPRRPRRPGQPDGVAVH